MRFNFLYPPEAIRHSVYRWTVWVTCQLFVSAMRENLCVNLSELKIQSSIKMVAHCHKTLPSDVTIDWNSKYWFLNLTLLDLLYSLVSSRVEHFLQNIYCLKTVSYMYNLCKTSKQITKRREAKMNKKRIFLNI